jgi:hypothetical protein
MHAPSFPEDSILKRHFESTVEMKRQKWLQTPPSDSILNRHAMSQQNQAAPAATSRSEQVRESAPVVSIGSSTRIEEEPKGFLARFFGLFGGR